MLQSKPSLAAYTAASECKHSALSLLMPIQLLGILLYTESSDPLLDDDLGSRAMAACCLCSSQMLGSP